MARAGRQLATVFVGHRLEIMPVDELPATPMFQPAATALMAQQPPAMPVAQPLARVPMDRPPAIAPVRQKQQKNQSQTNCPVMSQKLEIPIYADAALMDKKWWQQQKMTFSIRHSVASRMK